jgi:hypothetical protein
MFLKKAVLALAICLLSFSASQSLSAQEVDLDSVTTDQLNAEGPLTQNDIDLYLLYFETSIKALQKDQGASQESVLKMTVDFINNNKISVTRLRYILEKIPYSITALSGTPGEFTPEFPYLAVSDAEKELVNKNMPNIMSTIQKYAPSEGK